ncbi:hypothetical protein AB0A74_20155 [Saccharothrix sp. NPDC042600]|uniref:hypothetical protein n=1 Tax=Saccharothrix TaxID=2071 RepID=UPI0033CDE954|nr:hypothetical protein GCM10017745_75380 [Saccharothrix mutabilis subsp. capreolus]
MDLLPALIGPRSVSAVNQVAIPVPLMRLLGLSPGDQVFFEAVTGPEPEVRIVPARRVQQRYSEARDRRGSGTT